MNSFDFNFTLGQFLKDSNVLKHISGERSLQFELAHFIRSRFEDSIDVIVEKNVSDLLPTSNIKLKRDVDIFIKDNQKLHFIEIKASINEGRARPVTVFEFIRDIKFLQHVSDSGYKGYALFVTNESGFFDGRKNVKKTLSDFRAGSLKGRYYKKQSDSQSEYLELRNEIRLQWQSFYDEMKYCYLEF